MKVNFKILFVVVFLCSAFCFPNGNRSLYLASQGAKAQLKTNTCYFINAESGLNLRSGPGTSYDVVQKLPYGAQLKVVENIPAIGTTYIIDEGKKKYGQWVQVRPTFSKYHYANERKQYVFDIFLTLHLNSIPKASLHNFVELVHVATNEHYKAVTGVSSRRDMHPGGCDVRYENNPAAKEALKKIIQFEVVNRDDYIDQKITENYKLDTNWQPKKFKLENEYRPVEWEQYYLPIAKGRDSILIKDHTGEWASKTEYYGQIEELDSYLISGFAEDAEVILVNRTTGKKDFLCSGLPEISPNGEYLVSEYFNVFSNTTEFSIREFDAETIRLDYLIKFSSWYTAGEFFWISENVFVIAVLPMDSLLRNSNSSSRSKVIYLKGRIQF
jgi:hypothetical protein